MAKRSPARLRVRQATVRDLETLVHQRRGMWKDMGVGDKAALDRADVVYRGWARRRLKDGTLRGWLALAEHSIVAGGGCLWLQPVQPRPNYERGIQPYLLSMYTEPGFRRRGVASRVVESAVNWSRKQGYPSVRLHASEMGRPVYQELGFKRAWEMKLEFPRGKSKARV